MIHIQFSYLEIAMKGVWGMWFSLQAATPYTWLTFECSLRESLPPVAWISLSRNLLQLINGVEIVGTNKYKYNYIHITFIIELLIVTSAFPNIWIRGNIALEFLLYGALALGRRSGSDFQTSSFGVRVFINYLWCGRHEHISRRRGITWMEPEVLHTSHAVKKHNHHWETHGPIFWHMNESHILLSYYITHLSHLLT